jgi:hypothetical protein
MKEKAKQFTFLVIVGSLIYLAITKILGTLI